MMPMEHSKVNCAVAELSTTRVPIPQGWYMIVMLYELE